MSRNRYFDSDGNEYYPLEADEICGTEYCEDCIYGYNFPNGNPCFKCIDVRPMVVSGKYYKKRKISNSEWVRNLSDKDLANLISMYCPVPWCTPSNELCRYSHIDATPCEKCVLEWLKEEHSDG